MAKASDECRVKASFSFFLDSLLCSLSDGNDLEALSRHWYTTFVQILLVSNDCSWVAVLFTRHRSADTRLKGCEIIERFSFTSSGLLPFSHFPQILFVCSVVTFCSLSVFVPLTHVLSLAYSLPVLSFLLSYFCCFLVLFELQSRSDYVARKFIERKCFDRIQTHQKRCESWRIHRKEYAQIAS